jgi:hypothetical protein
MILPPDECRHQESDQMRTHQRYTLPPATSAMLNRAARFSRSVSRSVAGLQRAVTLMLAAALSFNALSFISPTNAMSDAVRLTAVSLVAPTGSRIAGAKTAEQTVSGRSAFGSLPVYFEENRGQASDKVKFIARGTNYQAFLTSDEAVFVLGEGEAKEGARGIRRSHKTDWMVCAVSYVT